MNAMEGLKDALDKSGVTFDDGAVFALLDNTLCQFCCGDGGFGGCSAECKPPDDGKV